MKFKLGTKVTSVKKEGGVVKVEVEPSKGGAKETVTILLFHTYLNSRLFTMAKNTESDLEKN